MNFIKIIDTFRAYLDGSATEKEMSEAVASALEYIEKRIEKITKL